EAFWSPDPGLEGGGQREAPVIGRLVSQHGRLRAWFRDDQARRQRVGLAGGRKTVSRLVLPDRRFEQSSEVVVEAAVIEADLLERDLQTGYLQTTIPALV